MAESIVGIDINGSGIRIVRLTATSRRVRLSGFAVAEAPVGADFKQLAALAKTLIDANGLGGDTYVVGLPAHLAFLRRFSFPFSSTNKINQVLAYEMEPQLPWPLQNVVVSYRKIARRQDGSQFVIAAALPKDTLTALLESFQEEGLPVAEVGLSVDCLDFLARETGESLPSRSIWLDIGGRQTQFMYLMDGMPACYRSLPWGCSEVAAGAGETPMVKTFSQEGGAALEHLVPEIIATVLAISPEAVRLPELIVVCGDAAGHDGLLTALRERFQSTVRQLRDFSGKRLDLPAEIHGQLDVLAMALGLALRKAAGSEALHFLHGEFAVKRVGNRRHRPRYVLAAAFVLAMVSLGLSIGIDLHVKATQLEALEAQARHRIASIVPDVQSDLSLKQYGSIIKERIQRLEEKKTLLGQKAPETNFVETLRLLSSVISTKEKVVFRSLHFDASRVRVTAEADSFETIENIKKELVALKVFQEIQIKDIKAKPAAGGAEFNFELVRKR